MSENLQYEREVFIENRKEDALQAAQSFALQMTCGIDLRQMTTSSTEKKASIAAVIPPFLTGFGSRIHAAIFSFCAGVIPPMPILGLSLLYVQSHFVANSCASSMLSMIY